MSKKIICLASLFSFPLWAAIPSSNSMTIRDPRPAPSRSAPARPPVATQTSRRAEAAQKDWMLSSFLAVGRSNPEKLFDTANKLFEKERLQAAAKDPALAYDWQHRLAVLGALAELFNPDNHRGLGRSQRTSLRNRARSLIQRAMIDDPALLVRDGAVESFRRISRMNPSEAPKWRRSLERAFLHPRSLLQGEGLFIRETILTALREASLNPSRSIKKAAQADRNPQVRELLSLWQTRSFDN